ncbi:uncharacterized protein E0L32_001934 [Thyridium curvatum]|uniref:ubiquitinyl hydrolase 1 n=1 Tax=Thyridium curvatum TaxID=1093900 RepID=A0A507ATV7_9PEZI|nr:uncharacterized protein E0L32_001745 [Thyridium curvatum]XP_030990070.1 uncharacterized protein E0L32_001934 [Thyridium curvatum]TPX08170.1 hypothetical protein E0L32_001745 [Thyridium curvatum]TPX08359.1 hypothetical protein E0L32_001934 [Thyridium curvatum]
MNAPESRYPAYYNPNIYQHPTYLGSLPDRLREPSIAVPVILLLLSIVYSSSWGRAPESTPIRQRLWDTTVSVLPAKLLYVVDDWMNPFPRSMLVPRLSSHQAKSEALARILGRDRHGGIVASVSHAGKTGLSKLMTKGRPDAPAGLGNSSNSCYQNSILQGLTALKPVREYLARIASDEEGTLPRIYVTRALGILIQDLYSPSKNGQTLWAPPMLKNMSTFQQQDAQEYFSKLLNEMQEEIEKDLKANRKKPGYGLESSNDGTSGSQHSDDSGYQTSSAISKAVSELNDYRFPLEGLTAQRVACLTCGYSSGLSMSQFQCVTLGLERNRQEYTLENMLDDFTEIEAIEGVQCANCTLLKFRDRIRILLDRLRESSGKNDEDLRAQHPQPFERLETIETALEEDDFEEKTMVDKCKIPKDQRIESTKSKQMAIARAPPSIAFYINRSKFDEYSGHFYKNPAAVRFPKLLDLGPWCLGSAQSMLATGVSEKEKNDASASKEQWQLPPSLSIVAGSMRRTHITGPFYELRAVLTHYGRHENGHYICYRKHPVNIPDVDHTLNEKHKDEPANLASEASGDDVEDTPIADEDAKESDDTLIGETQSHWWRISDQDVTKVEEATVMAQGGVFMLFYDRIDPNSVLVADEESRVDDKTDDDETLVGVEEVSGVMTPTDDGPLIKDEIVVGNGGLKAAVRSVIQPGVTTIEVAPSEIRAASRKGLETSIDVAQGDVKAAERDPLPSSIQVASGEVKAASRDPLASSIEVASAQVKAASREELPTSIEVAPGDVKAASRAPLSAQHSASIEVAPSDIKAASRQPLDSSIEVAPGDVKPASRSAIAPPHLPSIEVASGETKAAARSDIAALDSSISVASSETKAAVRSSLEPVKSSQAEPTILEEPAEAQERG